MLWVRNAGSYPGTSSRTRLSSSPPATTASGRERGARADEYFVIESTNPKVVGFDAAARSFVDYLYELAAVR